MKILAIHQYYLLPGVCWSSAPLLGLVAFAIRLSMGAPALVRQQRPGLFGWPFMPLKFRTMRTGPGSDATRLTPVGRFLRRSSLDELPALWNVARGNMSLVGPRPLLMQYLDRYTREQARRHEVRPGITGWAQVNAARRRCRGCGGRRNAATPPRGDRSWDHLRC